ncbi:4-hydroxy-tetrahydrodipicolinate reductase [Lachnospiraceae bacterium KM106-2]|nr:4-hydroxy-tetrahydrodipicolinate reductase [Lachnospiraceae bacterium KM106-2]
MINIIMHGCNGHMGQVITNLVKDDPDCQIVAGIDLNNQRENGYPVFESLEDCHINADVIIDFANARAIDSLLANAAVKGLPIVLCTTGLSEEQLDLVKKTSKLIPILKSANMSLGINTIFKLLQQAVQVLGNANFDVEIVEKHHNQKVDAPSGTAIALADVMNHTMNGKYEYVYDRSHVRKKRGKKELGISSVRGGSIVGEHEVIFAGTDEVIEIKHTAYSKAVFAKGAIQAAKYLAGKEPGMYDMSNVIG